MTNPISTTTTPATETQKNDIQTFLTSWSNAVENASSTDSLNLINVMAHYSDSGVLWGTISESLRVTPNQIQHYFEHFCPKVKGKTDWRIESILCANDLFIVNGSYIFQLTSGAVPARFTFIVQEQGSNNYQILSHHSSAMPENGLGLPD